MTAARNWQVCPRCLKRAQQPAIDATQHMKDAYGQVSLDEFEALREQAAAVTLATPDQSVSEVYTVDGITDSRIVFIYSASCGVCGLTVDFTAEHAVTWDEP